MFKTILVIVSVITLFVFTACQENPASSDAINNQDVVISKTNSMTNGPTTLISAVKTSDDKGNGFWEVRIDMPGDGGIVKFEYLVSNNELHQIKGLSPSFEYEITPGQGLVTYSVAKANALNAVNGQILEWKLEKDESDNMWQYRFEILSNGNNFEVRLNAANGIVIRIKN